MGWLVRMRRGRTARRFLRCVSLAIIADRLGPEDVRRRVFADCLPGWDDEAEQMVRAAPTRVGRLTGLHCIATHERAELRAVVAGTLDAACVAAVSRSVRAHITMTYLGLGYPIGRLPAGFLEVAADDVLRAFDAVSEATPPRGR